jgi:hypothetical protein
MKLFLMAFAALVLVTGVAAWAQTPATTAKLTMPNCSKPVTNGKVDTDEAADLFFKQLADYKACMMKYINEQSKIAAPYLDAANTTNREFAAWVASSPAVAAALAPPVAAKPAKK